MASPRSSRSWEPALLPAVALAISLACGTWSWSVLHRSGGGRVTMDGRTVAVSDEWMVETGRDLDSRGLAARRSDGSIVPLSEVFGGAAAQRLARRRAKGWTLAVVGGVSGLVGAVALARRTLRRLGLEPAWRDPAPPATPGGEPEEDDEYVQVVGRTCATCGRRIVRATEGLACRSCGAPLHRSCAGTACPHGDPERSGAG